MRYLTGTLHVDGVFCTGVMGEFWSLTKEERKRIVEIVVEEARGKCGVIAQTGSTSAHETDRADAACRGRPAPIS